MSLRDERTAVAESLTAAGLRGVDHVPGRITPPIAMVVPGSPYLESSGQPFGSKTLRLDVWLVVGAGDNAVIANRLDEHIAIAVEALEDADWLIENVAQPFPYAPQGGEFLTSIVSIRGYINNPERTP